MEIKLRPVNKKDRAEMKRMKKLFLTAFPPEERPPFRVLKRRAKENVDWLAIEADGETAGFFYTLKRKDLYYLMFFAVEEKMRGRGIGEAALLQAIKRYSDKRLFLSIERPYEQGAENAETRKRRKAFYLRCGFSETGREAREGSVIYEVLGINEPYVERDEYIAIMKEWVPLFVRLTLKLDLYEKEKSEE